MNRTIRERPIDKSAILRPIGPVFRRSKALFLVRNVQQGLQVLQNEIAMKIRDELRENASELTMSMKMCESTSRWLRSPVSNPFKQSFACQVMLNVVQGPPGCYECVAIISSQELTVTQRSNQQYDIVNNTSLLRWIPVCSHFGNKTLRSSSIPQICFDALRQNQLEKGNKERRRRPCRRCHHRNRRRSSADC